MTLPKPEDCLIPALAKRLSERQSTHFFVLGSGRSGRAAVALLESLGHRPVGYDDKGTDLPHPFSSTPQVQVLLKHSDKARLFPHEGDVILVLSPGVPLYHPLCLAARHDRITVISETELGIAFLPSRTRCLAVTGTNGKSTVVHATRALLESHGERSHVVASQVVALGNIGMPVCEFVLTQARADLVVIELSSYQLESMTHRVFEAAAITNFSSDHLARYKTMEAYFLAKWRLCSLLKPGAPLAIGQDVLEHALTYGFPLGPDHPLTIIQKASKRSPSPATSTPLWGAFAPSLERPFSAYWASLGDLRPEAETLASTLARITYEARDDASVHLQEELPNGHSQSLAVTRSVLLGSHNAENLSFCRFFEKAVFPKQASQLSDVFDRETKCYKPLAHRQERLSFGANLPVTIVNDSKSTSFVCTAMALRCYPKRVHLLIGGALKDDPVSDLLPRATAIDFASVSCFGPEAKRLAEDFETLTGVKALSYPTLEEATQEALKRLKPHETLLLSPGAASFDAYRNFEERGDHFRELVRKHFAQGEGH